jgi:hypothetical protein
MNNLISEGETNCTTTAPALKSNNKKIQETAKLCAFTGKMFVFIVAESLNLELNVGGSHRTQ